MYLNTSVIPQHKNKWYNQCPIKSSTKYTKEKYLIRRCFLLALFYFVFIILWFLFHDENMWHSSWFFFDLVVTFVFLKIRPSALKNNPLLLKIKLYWNKHNQNIALKLIQNKFQKFIFIVKNNTFNLKIANWVFSKEHEYPKTI